MIDSGMSYAPRDWVMANMSCQRGTAILSESIKKKALELGKAWTHDLAVRISGLHGLNYWDPEIDRQNRFAADYDFLPLRPHNTSLKRKRRTSFACASGWCCDAAH